MKDDLVGVDRKRALREDHVAGKRPDLGLHIHVAGIGLIVDRLVAIGLLGEGGRGVGRDGGDARHKARVQHAL